MIGKAVPPKGNRPFETQDVIYDFVLAAEAGSYHILFLIQSELRHITSFLIQSELRHIERKKALINESLTNDEQTHFANFTNRALLNGLPNDCYYFGVHDLFIVSYLRSNL